MYLAFTLMGGGDYRNPVISCSVSQEYCDSFGTGSFIILRKTLDICTKGRPYLEKEIVRTLAQRSSSYCVTRGELL